MSAIDERRPPTASRTTAGRRSFLKSAAAAAAADRRFTRRWLQAAELEGGGLLAPRPTHHPAKAQNLIMIFLTGGFSHVDTFDYKPALNRYHGKPVPSFGLRSDETHDRPLHGLAVSVPGRAASRA